MGSYYQIIEFPEGSEGSEVHINFSNAQSSKFIIKFLNDKGVLTLIPTGAIKTTDGFTLHNYDMDSNFFIKMIILLGNPRILVLSNMAFKGRVVLHLHFFRFNSLNSNNNKHNKIK